MIIALRRDGDAVLAWWHEAPQYFSLLAHLKAFQLKSLAGNGFARDVCDAGQMERVTVCPVVPSGRTTRI